MHGGLFGIMKDGLWFHPKPYFVSPKHTGTRLLEQGFRRTGVGCTDADALGYRWRNAVNGNRRCDVLGLDSGAKEDDGEGDKSGTRGECLLGVFVEQLPSRGNLDDDVAAQGGAEAVAELQDVVVAVEQALGGVDIGHSGVLHQELLATGKDFGDARPLLLEELVVEVHLVLVARLHIASLSVDGSQVHVEQVGRAVDVERACGDAVLREVGIALVGISRAGDDEEDVLGAHLLLDARDELAERVVELHVDALHLGLPVCHVSRGLGGREGDAEHVAHLVVSHRATADGLHGHLHNGVVDKLLILRYIQTYVRISL